MAQQGTTTIDFGAFPGATDITVTVTGISGTPAVGEAWVIPSATVDHSADEHWADPPRVVAGLPAAGSMVIYGSIRDSGTGNSAKPGMVYGKWTIGWVVN